MTKRDQVDLVRRQWARERPDLDSAGFAIVGRILMLGRLFERRVKQVLAPLSLELWAFDVLATLRRQGPPHALSAGELSRATLLTPGAMTNRIDRLEAAGLVRREPEPGDRRGVRVVLTARGLALVDRAIAERFAEAADAVAGLRAKERRELERLLRSLALGLEQPES